MRNRRWALIGLGVLVAVAFVVVAVRLLAILAVAALLSAFTPPKVDPDAPPPPQYEAERRLMTTAIEDVRFMPPTRIGTRATMCTAGGFAGRSEICGYEGEAVFPGDADQAALRAHLAGRGWSDNAATPIAGLDYHRRLDDRDVCLSARVFQNELRVEVTARRGCEDHDVDRGPAWAGWDRLAPEPSGDGVPRRLYGHLRHLSVAPDGTVVVSLRYRAGYDGGLPTASVDQRRYGGAGPCGPAPCVPERTTPGGHELYRSVDPARRHTVIGATALALVPGDLTDAEVDRLVDSLAPTPWAEIVKRFHKDG